jgi:hypothetical protein
MVELSSKTRVSKSVSSGIGGLYSQTTEDRVVLKSNGNVDIVDTPPLHLHPDTHC